MKVTAGLISEVPTFCSVFSSFIFFFFPTGLLVVSVPLKSLSCSFSLDYLLTVSYYSMPGYIQLRLQMFLFSLAEVRKEFYKWDCQVENKSSEMDVMKI